MKITSISVDGVALRRGERRLFAGLSFSVAAGEAVALIGANGAGKTTLLRAIAGFVAPESGTIAFAGADGPLEPDEARAASLHLLGHQDGLKGARTAREELAFQTRWTGGDANGARDAADMLGLAPLLDLEVRKLSAGQRRRLALARLVASPRALWLLDEPMAPLDARHRALFGEILARHTAAGGLVIAAVHDPLPGAGRAVEIGA